MVAKGKGQGTQPDDVPGPPGSLDLIGVALIILAEMRKKCGVGVPNEGDAHRTGAAAFERVAAIMDGTRSPVSWQGSAANAHAEANEQQQRRAREMSEVDAAVADIVRTEAGHVQATRDAIDDAVAYLEKCAPIADALSAIKRVGEIASLAFQAKAVSYALPPAKERFATMAVQSGEYAQVLRSLTAGYPQTAGGGGGGGGADALRVAPGDLLPIADGHHIVARSTADAAALTTQVADDVIQSHGIVCTPTFHVLLEAETIRAKSAAKIQARSEYLGDSVKSAADQYAAADRRLSEGTNRLQFPA